MISNRLFRFFVAFTPLTGVIFLISGAVAGSHVAAQGASKTIDLQFVNHIQAGMPEQDVLIEKDGKVVRVEGSDPLSTVVQPVYATANPITNDPFKVGANPLGPFEKGAPLGFTLAQWLGATGSGTYVVDGNNSQLKLSFKGLVPGGVYTVWCSRLTFPPNVKVVHEPCGASDGSQNSFKAANDGSATFNLTLNALADSTKETASVIVVNYHSNGKTYGKNPDDLGQYTHVQIFAIVPVPAS